jgi:hypothetical protein
VDLQATIRELRAELEEIDRAIAALEGLGEVAADESARAGKPGRKRGRKGMSAEERQQVSERVKRYWAQRRGQENRSGST